MTEAVEEWATRDYDCPVCTAPMRRYSLRTPPKSEYAPNALRVRSTRGYWKCGNGHRMMIEEEHGHD